MTSHRPIWGGAGRLHWVTCACGSWQSGAYRNDAEAHRAYTAHLTRLVHTTGGTHHRRHPVTVLDDLLTESHTDEIRVCDSCGLTWHGPFPCWCCAGSGTVIALSWGAFQ